MRCQMPNPQVVADGDRAGRTSALAPQEALAAHLVGSPHDQPDLDAVVRRRVSGTDHAADQVLELVEPGAPSERRH